MGRVRANASHAIQDPPEWFYGLWRLHALWGWHYSHVVSIIMQTYPGLRQYILNGRLCRAYAATPIRDHVSMIIMASFLSPQDGESANIFVR